MSRLHADRLAHQALVLHMCAEANHDPWELFDDYDADRESDDGV